MVAVAITYIRLVDGSSPNEGRLEVSDPAQGWGTVCSIGWDIKDTEVVCRELGFQGANSFVSSNSPFGQGSAPILITNSDCNGNESSLNDCIFDETASRCTHQQDVGIICQKPGYIGCFGDSFERLFQGASFDDPVGMTIDACLGFCRNQNFPFAGVEYASECYCADSDTRYDAQGTYDDSECQYICSGNTLERCGGNRRISVFNTTLGFCDDPGEPEYGTRQGDWFRYGASVTFDCAEGYNLTGNQSVQCLSVDGSPLVDWNADTPVCLEVPPTTTKATEETDITLDVSTDTTAYESTGTAGTMTSVEEVDTTGPPDGSTQATPTIPSTTEGVTPKVGLQGGRWPWPPMAIGFLLGGIILFLLIVVFVICLVVISPRAKAKKEEVKAVRLRNAARHSTAGNSYSPNIVLDRDGRRSVRSNGIQRVEESETYDNGAFLADDASIIGVYGERQRAVENPYATFRTDDTAKKILFADTARKLNQIYVPGSPDMSTVSRGTRRSSSDRYGAQLVV
ncbi:uncharacterized protein LOC105444869 [Strongylocentrotus purpuratus]|uniref:Uncharacterized protein n=1 Tax=Strongylocentrotus purpuratus TaxID=7668 RepID=A0A7M7SXZ0_STRPU|nr:uncharacterized protein LOC105444869 [Strongylocentrotus purpuratus]